MSRTRPSASTATFRALRSFKRKNPVAKTVVDKFKAQGYDPEGYTLYTYAAIQAYTQAVTRAKSTKTDDVLKFLNGATFDTVLGLISFNAKGDVTTPAYRVYAWKDGKYDYVN